MKVCRDHGPSRCDCHPDATHKHYRAGRWHEYTGHRHDIIAPDGRNTVCTHAGCTYTGTLSPYPALVRR